MKYRKMNLQLFAEETGGSTGASNAAEAGGQLATGTQAAEVSKDGNGQVATGQAAEPKRSFEELIKGEYKTEFDDKVQGIVKGRIKESKQLQARMNKIAPVMELFARRYGIDASDMSDEVLDQIIERTLDDNAFYEEEAMKRGLDVDVYKDLQQTKRENETLKRFQDDAIRSQENQQKFLGLKQEEAELQKIYPDFNLDDEMSNPNFERLAWGAGVPLKTAYEVVHHDEIMAAGMQTVAMKTAEKISASIQSGTYRPKEGGVSGQSASVSEVKKFSKKEIEDIKRRVREGERVVL